MGTSRRVCLGLAVMAVAIAGAGCQAAPLPAEAPGLRTLADACHAPATVEKGGTSISFAWRIGAQLDARDASVVVLASDLDFLLCEAARRADGTFGVAVAALGRLDPLAGPSLSYDTGIDPTRTAPRLVLAGRVPPGTATVGVTAADGAPPAVALGDGFFIARVPTPGAVVRIVARAADGRELARLDNPDGLAAGTVTTATTSAP